MSKVHLSSSCLMMYREENYISVFLSSVVMSEDDYSSFFLPWWCLKNLLCLSFNRRSMCFVKGHRRTGSLSTGGGGGYHFFPEFLHGQCLSVQILRNLEINSPKNWQFPIFLWGGGAAALPAPLARTPIWNDFRPQCILKMYIRQLNWKILGFTSYFKLSRRKFFYLCLNYYK